MFALPADVDQRPVVIDGAGTLGRRIASVYAAGGHEAWELSHALFSLGYTDALADEGAIEEAARVAGADRGEADEAA